MRVTGDYITSTGGSYRRIRSPVGGVEMAGIRGDYGAETAEAGVFWRAD